MRRRLMAKGVPPEKIAVVPNWIDADEVRPTRDGTLRAQMGQRFVVMYAGNLGLSQPLEVVLRAAERLRDEPGIAFVVIGEGARGAALRSWARRARLDNVVFLPFRPRPELSASLGAADLHIVPLRAGLAGCLVPSKVYGILAVGRPLVALMEPDAEVARLVAETATGFVVAPDDVEGLVRTIKQAAADPTALAEMGARARQLAEERFDRRLSAERFAAVVDAAFRFSRVSR
jgi:glycosyltransferase involved in cell wall biosynthesis